MSDTLEAFADSSLGSIGGASDNLAPFDSDKVSRVGLASRIDAEAGLRLERKLRDDSIGFGSRLGAAAGQEFVDGVFDVIEAAE